MADKKEQAGEGDRDSDRRYRKRTEKFVESGRVDEKAEDAKPNDPGEAEELKKAEEEGRKRAKERDPAVKRDYSDAK